MSQHADFELYSRALMESKDVDPTYPVVKSIIKSYHFEPEWFVFCYVAFYSLESGIKMCKEMPTSGDWNINLFKKMREEGYLKKFGHERRGTQRRIENQVEMFNAVIEFLNELEHMEVEADGYGTEPFDNPSFRKRIEALPNHGSWAAYKIAELFEKSLDKHYLTIPDLGIDDKDFSRNDGPLGGLRWLFDPTPDRTHKFDKKYWLPIFNRFGQELSKAWGVDMGQVETCLCKWHKMKTGNYFVGHDIAEFLELRHVMSEERYQSIMCHFDPRFWEHHTEFPKELKPVYKTTKKIVNDDFATRLPQIDVMQIIQDL